MFRAAASGFDKTERDEPWTKRRRGKKAAKVENASRQVFRIDSHRLRIQSTFPPDRERRKILNVLYYLHGVGI